jgi:hypothetical protein
LGKTLTNQNSIQEEIKSRMKSGNACYPLVQNFLSSSLLFKNLKIKIYRTIILPVVLYGCEIWWITLREEQKPRLFENRALRKIFGPKRGKVKGERRKLHNEELNDLYSSLYSSDQIEKNEIGRACSTCGREGRYKQGFDVET